MKKFVLFLFVIIFLLSVGCAKTKVLHCDNCNSEVKVEETSNMEEEWTIYCDKCNEELFGDDPLLGN